MEAEKPHTCSVCGGFDFLKENGYFYCLECQTQCEEIRELVFEAKGKNEEEGEELIGTPFITKKIKKKEKSKRKGEDFTSWEILNFLLRGLVEELLSAGAPSSLKDSTLQLWTYYLKKLEVAFVSKEEKVLPKFGRRYYSGDAKMLYGLTKKKPVKKCKVMDCSLYAELNTTISSLPDWSAMQLKKKMKSKAKKALMEKVAENIAAETSMADSESSTFDQSSVLNTSDFDDSLSVSSIPLSLPESESSVSPCKLERSKAAKDWLLRNSRQEDDTLNDSRIPSENPKNLTRFKLVVVLYLALLYEGSKIQISDLLRWIREGHLSYYEAGKYLPETCFVQGTFTHVFGVASQFPVYSYFLKSASNLGAFLQMVDWPVPDVSELAKKYVTELQLPEMFSNLIVRFVAVMPLSYKLRIRNEIPNYEGRILAVLIIILKLLFGLDGKTEHQISKTASQLNELLKQKEGYTDANKLFVWKDWVKQLICRSAVLSRYHFPTKHILCPEVHGNPYSYINYSQNLIDANPGFQEKYVYQDLLKVAQPALLNTFTSILEKLQDPALCEKQNIKFPQCLRPNSVYIKNILEKSAEMDEPLITKSAEKILTEDFSKCDIMYLLLPQSVSYHAEANGQLMKIKNKSAQKRYTKFRKLSRITKLSLRDYQKQCYVSVLNCSKQGKQKDMPEHCDNEEYAQMKTREKKEKKLKVSISEEHRDSRNRETMGENERHSDKRKLKKKKKKKSEKICNAEDISRLSTKSRKRQKQNCSSRNSKKEFKMSLSQECKDNRINKKLQKYQICSDKSKLKKNKKIKSIKSQNSKHPSHLSTKSRKRRKNNSSSRNSKKIKLSKCLKLYVPCSKYWVHFGGQNLHEGAFETDIFRRFPHSFSWLLTECAFVSEMPKVTLYKEILRIEEQCRNVFR